MSAQTRFQQAWLQAVWHTGALLLLAGVAGLFINQLRPEGLSLVADWSPEARLVQESGDSLVISLEEAMDLFFSRNAVFLDARAPDLFEFGHVLGSRNLPWEEFDAYYNRVMKDIRRDAQIITYCDGEGCSLSKELALALTTEGYQNVRVLVNGWRRWEEHRLPVVTGKFPGSL